MVYLDFWSVYLEFGIMYLEFRIVYLEFGFLDFWICSSTFFSPGSAFAPSPKLPPDSGTSRDTLINMMMMAMTMIIIVILICKTWLTRSMHTDMPGGKSRHSSCKTRIYSRSLKLVKLLKGFLETKMISGTRFNSGSLKLFELVSRKQIFGAKDA